MTAEQYNSWTAPLRDNPRAARVFLVTNRVLTWLGYVSYPLLVVLVAACAVGLLPASAAEGVSFGLVTGGSGWAVDKWGLLTRVVLVPAGSFCLMSAMRKVLNKPRPYEVLAIDPLIHKSTRGKSFPSRHVFSSVVIAMAWLTWCVPVGVALLVASALMAVVRVLGGVHWPRDVVAGAALGVLAGLLVLI